MPITPAIAVAGLAVAGTGITAYGQYMAGQQARQNMEYNAAVQQAQAAREEAAAHYEAGKFSEQAKSLQARQRVLFAKAGVSLEGTPLAVLQETANHLQRDLDMIYWSGRQRADYYRSEAGLSILEGRSAARAGTIQAGASLLSGFSSAYGSYYQMKRP